MANSEVLLLEPIEALGAEGDRVTVRPGYARNYLLPQKKALPVNRANRKLIDALLRTRALREAKQREGADALAEKLRSTALTIAVKTGANEKLFGSVTATDILTHLEKEGISIPKKKLHVSSPIKSLGTHTVVIKLHEEVTVDFSFEVISENPIQEDEKPRERKKG